MLLLHLLMVASTLLGLSGNHKFLHCLEDLIHPSHLLVDKMRTMNLQKPMVFFIFFSCPVSSLQTLGKWFWEFSFLLGFFIGSFGRLTAFGFGVWWLTCIVACWVDLLLSKQAWEDLIIGWLSGRIKFFKEGEREVCFYLEVVIREVTLAHII